MKTSNIHANTGKASPVASSAGHYYIATRNNQTKLQCCFARKLLPAVEASLPGRVFDRDRAEDLLLQPVAVIVKFQSGKISKDHSSKWQLDGKNAMHLSLFEPTCCIAIATGMRKSDLLARIGAAKVAWLAQRAALCSRADS